MIIVYHDNGRCVEIYNTELNTIVTKKTVFISELLLELAYEFSDSLLVWCHVELKKHLNVSEIESLFHHRKLLLSYNPTNINFLGTGIGYVDESPFIKVPKGVSFPTWQMSSWVGGIHAELLLATGSQIPLDSNFDYYITSLAKLGMSKGLFCYSEPSFLLQKANSNSLKANTFELFRFVKQHYKTRWIFLLLINLLVYERKFPIIAAFCSLFYKNRTKLKLNLNALDIKSSKQIIANKSIDVIIPTIGRKAFLYDILQDLSKQTLLPQKIIIVEQNPFEGSVSELNYVLEEKWPFQIKVIFTHQTGVCNARNLGILETNSEWTFLADDDIRIEADFFQKAMTKIDVYGVQVLNFVCSIEGQKQSINSFVQWESFGGGCSLVFTKSLRECRFGMQYEFGYGEDGDFGMQLRNKGYDIMYCPDPAILHLKAPIGGFRSKPKVMQWHNETIQPKPAPTVMVYLIFHSTKEQIRMYKTTLFFKYYNHQSIRNPYLYYTNFQKQWNSSVYWGNKLAAQNEI